MSMISEKAKNETYNMVKIHELINFDQNVNEEIKVSIIIPVCNVECYLKQCLDSAVNQTLQEIEIICVNDGSTDHSLQILKEYAKKDRRVKIIDKDNAGYGHTMNIGMDMAKGEYIGIIESDDYVDLNMYKDLYEIAHKYGLDLIKADFNRFLETEQGIQLFYNKVVRKPSQYNRIIDPEKEINIFRGVMNTWSGIYSKKFLDKYNIRHNETPGASYQDNGFYFQTFCNAKKVYFVNRPYYMNRRDNPNSSVYATNKVFCMKEEFEFIERLLKQDPKKYKTFKFPFMVRKFLNYRFTYNRIDDTNKKLFLKVFYEDFKKSLECGDVNLDFFNNEEKNELSWILRAPQDYYESTCSGKIRISIIIPVYNEEIVLKECLDRIREQSLREIEIICIDDGSTDRSLEILKEYQEMDSRFIVLEQENLGAGAARNYGLSVAKGEFVAFMDADDWYPSPSVLRNLYIAAKSNQCLICGGSFSWYKDNQIISTYDGIYVDYKFNSYEKIKFEDYQFDYGYQRFIYSRNLLIENNIKFPKYKRYQDPPFFVKAMVKAGEFYAIDQIVYRYRKQPQKITWTKEKVFDLLCGIEDNIALASQKQLKKLLVNNVMRINHDYIKIIMPYCTSENIDVIMKLFSIQSTIDLELLDMGDFILKPLYRLMFADNKVTINDIRKAIREEMAPVFEDKKRMDAENEYLRNELTGYKESFSYKFGHCVTAIPRKIYRLVKPE